MVHDASSGGPERSVLVLHPHLKVLLWPMIFGVLVVAAAGRFDPGEVIVQWATDEQATKIKTIVADMLAERREIMQSAGDDRQAAGQKVQTLTKETGEKILALLSADQKKTWKELTGEPFTLPPMQRRPGGNR